MVMSKFTEYEKLMLELQVTQTLLSTYTTMMVAAKQSKSETLIEVAHEIHKDAMKRAIKLSNKIA